MRTLVIPAVLVLTLSMAPVAAVAGENPGVQSVPESFQQMNDTQLRHFSGKLGATVDSSLGPKNAPQAVGQAITDTINFSENVIATMKGYNTHPPDNPSIGAGAGGNVGPNSNIGPSWARGQDITVHMR